MSSSRRSTRRATVALALVPWAWLMPAATFSGRAPAADLEPTVPVAETSAPVQASPPRATAGKVETTPVRSEGDAADDVAVWVHPTQPALSLVIGTDKRDALEVYDLAGRRIQRIAGGRAMNNVDLRTGFSIGGEVVPLVATAGGGLRFFRLDERRLTEVTAPPVQIEPAEEDGVCLYRSRVSGTFYAFTTGPKGWVDQWELVADGDRVDARLVRGWHIGSRLESCVVDDDHGRLYVSEERVGIWEYGAEPGAPLFPRILVDVTGPAGHLTADVEGLAIVEQPGGDGYLLASSQGDHTFVAYRRGPDHAFLGKLRVVSGGTVDGCSDTDGIEATSSYLGPSFPAGIFVCQDGRNTLPGSAGRQNFKYLPLEAVLDFTESQVRP